MQAFWRARKDMEGYVTPTGMSRNTRFFYSKYFSAFFNIMKQIRPYQLTSWTEEHLIALAQVFNKGHNVNFAFFQAFNNLMKNMELGKFTK